jgi:hypothetical protein
MSIYCYVDNKLIKIPSVDIENINSLDKFKSFIKEKLNMNDIYIDCHHNFSTLSLINFLNSNEKVKKNYIVTTSDNTNDISFLNLNTLCNIIYQVPKLMTLDEFKKNFCDDDNNIEIYIKNKKMNDNEKFIENNKYFYKITLK